MLYKGSCHCGKVAYEVEGELTGVMECNCSMCSRKAPKMWFVPRAQLRLVPGAQEGKTYKFNKHVISHRFCTECGIHAYGLGVDPKGNEMAMVNVRCLEGVDQDALPVTHFDGRSMP